MIFQTESLRRCSVVKGEMGPRIQLPTSRSEAVMSPSISRNSAAVRRNLALHTPSTKEN